MDIDIKEISKEEILKEFKKIKKEVLNSYKYDCKNLNSYLCKIYIKQIRSQGTVREKLLGYEEYEKEVYTYFNKLGLTEKQIDKIRDCHYLKKILVMSDNVNSDIKIYISNLDIRDAYAVDKNGNIYYFGNELLPYNIASLNYECEIDNNFIKKYTTKIN